MRGSAVNHDGRSNGLTAPNGAAQEAVLVAALADARVEPGSVGYLEAHGTGTSLGDPIEVAALVEVLGKGRPRDRPLALGSVKTNFGHLEAAAGVAGVVKAVLVLEHGEVPPHLHFSRPNPLLPLASAPFAIEIPTRPTPLPSWDGPRRAGVSSFGLSGINAHVVLEEAPGPARPPEPLPPGAPSPGPSLDALLLSARSEGALRSLAGRYAALLRGPLAPDFPDVCFTAATGRTPFERRRFAPPWEGVRRGFEPLAGSLHPLLGRRVPLALAPGERFEVHISSTSPPFLADHRVHGTVLFPAAGFAEMVLVAAREVTGVGRGAASRRTGLPRATGSSWGPTPATTRTPASRSWSRRAGSAGRSSSGPPPTCASWTGTASFPVRISRSSSVSSRGGKWP